MTPFSKGDWVEWTWGSGSGTGRVTDSFTGDVTRTIKGTRVTRRASRECPAYLIEQEGGDRVLKSHSEIRSA